MVRVIEIVFFRKEYIDLFFNKKWLVLKIWMEVILYRLSSIYLGEYMCIYICIL